MNQTLLGLVALTGVSALAFAGCAPPPEPNPSPPVVTATATQEPTPTESSTPPATLKACMVSDVDGFADKSINETARKGLVAAQQQFGIETGQIESSAEDDFAPNIQSMIDANCHIIFTIGDTLANATEAAAKQNPDIKFAIVDHGSFDGLTNVRGLEFNTAESSFMGGYLAAAMSRTGKVGTFGGAKVPAVTIFMDGFEQGVDHYNETKGKNVQVVGWDAARQDGLFMPGDDPSGDIVGGEDTANKLIGQGADIILPVAGPAGVGALRAVQASQGKVAAIWAGIDGCVSEAEFCPSILSTVYEAVDVAVLDTVKAAVEGSYTSDPFVGTLKNEGTGLSPFHEFAGKVPAEVSTELDQIRADIVSGRITITSPAQPK